MTANSQFIAVKAIQALTRRGIPASVSRGMDRKADSGARLNDQIVKRTFDIVFSLAVLIVFSPLYFLLGLLIAVSSPGPIFYYQERAGKNFKSLNVSSSEQWCRMPIRF
ncbi:Undecaprenyl-phosphate galactosephosphotransferase [Crocosphaera watsonii WH 0005]|uniref:Undecaprenyl-phosphate galactosephosphotransferase n=1 Tax=Crocosphaera watsonii WH 0005 TaxID=423472 RepID=T2J112_CROWT|nr:Undecaprenyl-phosphate galactosephosphotransferase [Crocosphaera watsonii WH 0005]